MDIDLDETRDSEGSDANTAKPVAKTSKGRGSKSAAAKTKTTTTTTKTAKARKATPEVTPTRVVRAARPSKKIVVDVDSDDEEDNDEHAESDNDYRGPRAVGSNSKSPQTHVVLDTDDEAKDEAKDEDHHEATDHNEEDEDDFLVPKRGAKAKAKEVVKR